MSLLSRHSLLGGQNSVPLLLDGRTDVIRAYSIRKLRTDYTGDAALAEDWTNNNTYAVGFTGDKMNLAALISSTSGNNVGVNRWYDQSGSGEYLSEKIATNRQFRIKDTSNAFQTVNGYPVFESKPLGQLSRVWTEDFSLPTITLPYTVVWTVNNISTGAGASKFIWDRPTAAFNNVYARIQPDDEIGFFAGGEQVTNTVTIDKYVMMMVVTGGTSDYIRSVSSVDDDAVTASIGGLVMNSLNIGSSRNLIATNAYDGNIMDFMIFDGDLRNDSTLINNLKTLIGI